MDTSKKSANNRSIDIQICLQVIEIADLEKIYLWKNNFELSSLIMSHPLPVSIHQLHEWFERNQADRNQVLFGIYLLNNSQIVGIVRLMFIDWISSHAELGIYIGEDKMRNQGIGKESMKLILQYAFKKLNLSRIYLRVLEGNNGVIRLYQSLGFAQEGILRRHYWVNGKYENVLIFGILRSEYLNVETMCNHAAHVFPLVWLL